MRRQVRAGILGAAAVVAAMAAAGAPAAVSGAWTRVPSADVPASVNRLIAVTPIPGSPEAWAVGTSFPTGGSSAEARPLIERWDGATWSLVPAAGTDTGAELDAVTAFSPSDAWAVGTHVDANGQTQPLSLHWNGATWTPVAMPGVPNAITHPTAVVEIGPRNVWAVGGARGLDELALVWHWNGRTWSRSAPTLPSGGTGGSFSAVQRVPGPSNWLIAAGRVIIDGAPRILVERYDGAGWAPISAPVPAGHAQAIGLAVRSTRDVWLTGTVDRPIPGGSTSVPYSAHWDGVGWTRRALPFRRGTTTGAATAISLVPGSPYAWAVGWRGAGPGDIPLTWRWNGGRWNAVPVPNPANGNVLASVATDASGGVWAAGWNENSTTGASTFIVRR